MRTFSASWLLPGLTGAVALCLTLGFREPPLPDAPQVSQVHGESFVARDLDFVLRNGATPEKHQIETMAGGVAVLDFDNDGHPDVFFANGATQPGLEKSTPADWNLLYHNLGNGTFEGVTEKSGLRQPQESRWAVGGGWLDYDNDGRLDLFVVNYVHWDAVKEPACGDPVEQVRTYCHPRFYQGFANQLFHNTGICR